jgi:hypothetical protein
MVSVYNIGKHVGASCLILFLNLAPEFAWKGKSETKKIIRICSVLVEILTRDGMF